MSGELLPLMEAFYTIQGEGYYKGTAAYFIRLAGCDVGCHWCDVKESWDATAHPLVPIEQIAEQALAHSKTIIITGGEQPTSPHPAAQEPWGTYAYRDLRGSPTLW